MKINEPELSSFPAILRYLLHMKHFLLDLGGVVFQSTGRSNQLIQWDIITRLNHQFGYALNVGQDRFPTFMEHYCRLSGQTLNGPDFLKAVFDTLDFNAPLVAFLQSLGSIYIVSDNYRENIAYISQRYRFADWSEKQFYSFDFAMIKEETGFFPRLLQDLDLPAEELLLIDDSPRKLASAKEVGIAGIQFQTNEQTFSAVNKHLGR